MTAPVQLGAVWPIPPTALPARLYYVFSDPAGNIYPFVRLNLYQPGTTVALAVRAFKDVGLSTPLEDDSDWSPGIIEVWFPQALRCRIEYTPYGGARSYIEDVDAHPDPATIVRSLSPLALEPLDTGNYVGGTLLVAQSPTGGTFTPPPLIPMTMDEWQGLDERMSSLEGIVQNRNLPPS